MAAPASVLARSGTRSLSLLFRSAPVPRCRIQTREHAHWRDRIDEVRSHPLPITGQNEPRAGCVAAPDRFRSGPGCDVAPARPKQIALRSSERRYHHDGRSERHAASARTTIAAVAMPANQIASTAKRPKTGGPRSDERCSVIVDMLDLQSCGLERLHIVDQRASAYRFRFAAIRARTGSADGI